MAINEKYSFKDWSDYDFSDRDPAEFNDSEIVGSCFYQENDPKAQIFPVGMSGVTFKRCNLDNVLVPPGNTIVTKGWEACTHKWIQIQNDGRDWILDNKLQPIRTEIKDMASNNPKDIPKEYIWSEKILKENYDKIYKNKTDFSGNDTWFKVKPNIDMTLEEDVIQEIPKWRWDQMIISNDWGSFKTKPELIENKQYMTNVGKVETVVIKGIWIYYIISGEGKLVKKKEKKKLKGN